MNNYSKMIGGASMLLLVLSLTSCITEDPGPYRPDSAHYHIQDFDRLEMGNHFDIEVQQGDFFEVYVEGDQRNIDDLNVRKRGGTLLIDYTVNRNRRYETRIYITMPTLQAASFSGASYSRIEGFSEEGSVDFHLSGSSVSQIDITAMDIDLVVSGASDVQLMGDGNLLEVQVSGASHVNAFNFFAQVVEAKISGASQFKTYVSDALDADVSGASVLIYKGDPIVESQVSGTSTIIHE